MPNPHSTSGAGAWTPGPWVETGDSDWHPDRYERAGGSTWTVLRSDSADVDVAIVMVDDRWGNDERLDANACLIAAAPALYEALVAMIAWANGDGDTGGYPGTQAAAALRLAQGGSEG